MATVYDGPMIEDDQLFPMASAAALRAAEHACRVAQEAGDEDWNSAAAAEARRLTAELGWSWDFAGWCHAASILDGEADLARRRGR